MDIKSFSLCVLVTFIYAILLAIIFFILDKLGIHTSGEFRFLTVILVMSKSRIWR